MELKGEKVSPFMAKHLKHKENIPKEIQLDQTCGFTFRHCNHCITKKELHRTKWMCTISKVPLCNNAVRKCFFTVS